VGFDDEELLLTPAVVVEATRDVEVEVDRVVLELVTPPPANNVLDDAPDVVSTRSTTRPYDTLEHPKL
jgi:hypothetical protein